MYSIVYFTKNNINNKIYVGVHSTYNLNDGYLGSGYALKRAFKKYGKENFTRTILFYCLDMKDAYEIESIIVDYNFVSRKDSYNLVLGGGCSNITKDKSYEEVYGCERADYLKNKISKGKTGTKHSDDTIKKLKLMKNALGSKKSEQEKISMLARISRKGVKLSPERCSFISSLNTGSNNGSAKHFIFTDPQGNIYNVIGTFVEFCKSNDLSIKKCREFINKGKIFYKNIKNSNHTKTNGWEITCSN